MQFNDAEAPPKHALALIYACARMKSRLTDDAFGTDAFHWLGRSGERIRSRPVVLFSNAAQHPPLTLSNLLIWTNATSSRIWFNLPNSIKNLFGFNLLKVIHVIAKLLYTISSVLKSEMQTDLRGAVSLLIKAEGKWAECKYSKRNKSWLKAQTYGKLCFSCCLVQTVFFYEYSETFSALPV